MNATLSRSTNLNGINTQALRDTVEAIRKNPALGNTSWTVESRWAGGTRSDHHVRGCSLGGTFIPRPFTIHVDEPKELLGTNQYANPQEYLLASINACMMVGYSAVAALMGISLTHLEIRTIGDIDLRGFLGLSDSVPKGYPSLKQEVHLAGDATPEQFKQLHDTVRATSPNFFNITHAVPVNSVLVLDQ